MEEGWAAIFDSGNTVVGLTHDAAGAQGLPVLLRSGLADIVGRSSRQQSLKGVLTAGLGRSIKYGASKLTKAWTT